MDPVSSLHSMCENYKNLMNEIEKFSVRMSDLFTNWHWAHAFWIQIWLSSLEKILWQWSRWWRRNTITYIIAFVVHTISSGSCMLFCKCWQAPGAFSFVSPFQYFFFLLLLLFSSAFSSQHANSLNFLWLNFFSDFNCFDSRRRRWKKREKKTKKTDSTDRRTLQL